MVVAGASMFGLMVFTCVGRFRRKDESYDSCSWNTAYLKLALFLDVTYAIVLTLIDFAACHFAWFTCDGFCYFTSNHLFFWTANRTHTHKWYFWKQHNIYRETRQIKTHSWLENIMWIYWKQQNFKQKKSLWNLGYDLN